MGPLARPRDIIDGKPARSTSRPVTSSPGDLDKDGTVSGGTLKDLLDAGITDIPVLDIDNINVGGAPTSATPWRPTRTWAATTALMDIYRVMRPGEPPTVDAASALFDTLFFDSERYDLSAVGRVKMNMRLDLDAPDTKRTLRNEDIRRLRQGARRAARRQGRDRRHRPSRQPPGALGGRAEWKPSIASAFCAWSARLRSACRRSRSTTVMPQDLINAKPAAAAVREFFGSSQLSQFMDRTNPLSEVTHKRRLSALGPGGLTRERAGFRGARRARHALRAHVPDARPPEGPNIGLINSLATFARVNKYGFIETPYRKVENGQVTDDVQYMSATEEMRARGGAGQRACSTRGRQFKERPRLDPPVGRITPLAPSTDVTLIDVSPKQLVSVAASLIPFLEKRRREPRSHGVEHAAHRRCRFSRPRRRSWAPASRRGRHRLRRGHSGPPRRRDRPGGTPSVSSWRATEDLEPGDPGVDIYRLAQVPAVEPETPASTSAAGEGGRCGDPRAKSSPTVRRPISASWRSAKNVVVAFMPWNGYNYEDSILISERIVRDGRLYLDPHRGIRGRRARHQSSAPKRSPATSRTSAREALRNLDEAGIVIHRRRCRPWGGYPCGQDHAQGRKPDDPPGRETAPRDLRRRRRPMCVTPRSGCRRATSARSSRWRVFTATASRRTSARSQIEREGDRASRARP